MNEEKDEVLNEKILQNKRNLNKNEYKFIKRLYTCYKKGIINIENLKIILNI